ncbi:hypothetical protein [Leifsonia xyli]|uniref:hypothetical protein n=1 Tax=Leifsonia xyli TaxID=1575 RepID=UPI003D6640A3
MKIQQLGRAVAVAAVAVLALTGCTSNTPDPEKYIGETLSAAMQHLNSPNVIDLSENVLHTSPTYNENADASAWIVVAGCYKANPQKISALGVIPQTDATPQIVATAKAGGYRHDVTC